MISFKNNYDKKLVTYDILSKMTGEPNSYVDLSNKTDPLWIPIVIEKAYFEPETYTATWNFDASANSIKFDINNAEGGIYWYYGSFAANNITCSTLLTSDNGWFVYAQIYHGCPISGYENNKLTPAFGYTESSIGIPHTAGGGYETARNEKTIQLGSITTITAIVISFNV